MAQPVAPTQPTVEQYAELKTKFDQQDSLIARVFDEPLLFGVVVEVSQTKPTKDLYQVGDLLKVIDRESEHYQSSGRILVAPDNNGIISVKITGDKGPVVNFSIGLTSMVQVKLIGKDDGTTCTVQTQDHLYSLINVPELYLEPGVPVKISPQTKQIIDRTYISPSGDVCNVKSICPDGKVEVDILGRSRAIYPGSFVGRLEVGDRVCLDSSNSVVTQKLTLETANEYCVRPEEMTVSWDDVGGCEQAKDELIEAFELPFKFPDVYKHYNKESLRGILLYGPPGCGKTLLAKAAATSLAKIHGKSALESGFIYIKGPELLDKWVGASEEALRLQFIKGEKHYQKYGYPAVLFIDEADSLLGRRGSNVGSSINDSMVATYLSEMSGLNATNVIAVLATNNPKTLDSAVLRDGRLDRHIKVPRPDIETAASIFDIYLRNIPLSGSVDMAIAMLSAEVFSSRYHLYDIHTPDKRVLPFALSDVVNGAMIKGIVDKASSIAMKRDMKSGMMTGVSKEEFKQAVVLSYIQNRDINHDLNLIDFAERHGLDPNQLKVEPVPSAV